MLIPDFALLDVGKPGLEVLELKLGGFKVLDIRELVGVSGIQVIGSGLGGLIVGWDEALNIKVFEAAPGWDETLYWLSCFVLSAVVLGQLLLCLLIAYLMVPASLVLCVVVLALLMH